MTEDHEPVQRAAQLMYDADQRRPQIPWHLLTLSTQEWYCKMAHAAISGYFFAIQQTHALVPKEASDEMVQAARGFCNNERAAEYAWSAMIEAAPAAP